MKYIKFICLFLVGVLFSCQKDISDDKSVDGGINSILSDVCVRWGMPIAELKESMTDYLILSEENDAIQYSKGDKEEQIIYAFIDDKLIGAALYTDVELSVSDISSHINGYTYMGMLNSMHVYVNQEINTIACMKLSMEEGEPSVYSFFPIESEFYDVKKPIEVMTGETSDIKNDSAVIAGELKNSDSDAQVGVLYATSPEVTLETASSQFKNANGSFTINLSGLQKGTTYYYCVVALVDGLYFYGDIRSFTTANITSGDENGYKWVDLGLPSGLKWAAYDVGADYIGDYGDYLAWGEIYTRVGNFGNGDYEWGTYAYSNGSSMTSIGNDISGTRYDAARSRWKAPWRMPTQSEAQELVDNCTMTVGEIEGVAGFFVTGPNGNCIFFPASGQYISSAYRGSYGCFWTSNTCDLYHAYVLYLSSSRFYVNSNTSLNVPGCERSSGYVVRPVMSD